LANNSSPLISKNLKPALNAGWDEDGAAPCAQAIDDNSDSAAAIVIAKAGRRLVFPCFILNITVLSRLHFTS
jgi:hypothetical protein